MLVGEQTGDYEDLAGKPFVGPAEKSWIAHSKKRESIAAMFT
jgi:uracil-DNA glycosylase